MNTTRQPYVEGRFYPTTRERMFDQIRQIERQERYHPVLTADHLIGAVLPHAGHVYSGYQTIPFFHLLLRKPELPDTLVIVHPNHTGRGLPLAIDKNDSWSNAAGSVPLDVEFAGATGLPFDAAAHKREHSAEVLIPYLQYFLKGHSFSIVPICMGNQDAGTASRVAAGIHAAMSATGRNILVLASTDFSHFLPPEQGRLQDQHVVDAILQRDIQGIEAAVRMYRVSMCGYGPVMALLGYAAATNPDYRVSMLARGHSGEVSPSPEVVDYISFVVHT